MWTGVKTFIFMDKRPRPTAIVANITERVLYQQNKFTLTKEFNKQFV